MNGMMYDEEKDKEEVAEAEEESEVLLPELQETSSSIEDGEKEIPESCKQRQKSNKAKEIEKKKAKKKAEESEEEAGDEEKGAEEEEYEDEDDTLLTQDLLKKEDLELKKDCQKNRSKNPIFCHVVVARMTIVDTSVPANVLWPE